jgi:predicted DNA-binding protein with PD1-like motif
MAVARQHGGWGPGVRSREVSIGRTIVAMFDHGDDFYTCLGALCEEHHLRSAYIPMFIAGFSAVDLVGTCERLEDTQAPVWSRVQLDNVEVLGGGTIAWDESAGTIAPHIHVSAGLKAHSALGHTSHLLDATVQFLTEMVLVEVIDPPLTRERKPDLYDVPLLQFGAQLP